MPAGALAQPIEGVRKRTKQQVHHLHRCVGHRQQLGPHVPAYFSQNEQPCEALRRVRVLTKPDGLYAQALGPYWKAAVRAGYDPSHNYSFLYPSAI